MGRTNVGIHGLNKDHNEIWKKVWKIGRPPNPSHFLRQACKGNMAVKAELFRRHIAIDEVCGCCGLEAKSVMHTLFFCIEEKATWASSKYGSMVNEASTSSFVARLLWLVDKVADFELRSIMAITRAIRYCRNKRVYEQIQLNGTVVAVGFVRLVDEHGSYAHKVRVWLESDALNIVKNVDARKDGLSPIHRVGNTVAHLVARWDTGGSDDVVCMNYFPQSLLDSAKLDLQ
ncbi:hypothetical protein RDABS01_037363 [Bienertia sinuspersici]